MRRRRRKMAAVRSDAGRRRWWAHAAKPANEPLSESEGKASER